ncbi:universal stress protein [Laspinema sp. D1]|uniref:Universal stress protein n=1 Tax=Laspinema palackyanum D2a TaxID=2953684 RepID=A0ABT2MX33_9CYAN|nr:universal stress protein [Laspinema sp. D2a]
MTYHKILAAIDRSPQSDFVIEQVLDLAEKEKAELMLFHAIQVEALAEISPMVGTGMGLSPSLGREIPELQRQRLDGQIQHTKEILQEYASMAMARNIPTICHHSVGDPGVVSCELARSWGANLIVVGRRGRKGMTELLLGSVSNYITHHAPCSVLIVQGALPVT